MSEEAIRKLKWKFIFYAMVSMTIVMFFMGGLIYATNLVVSRNEIRETMKYIVRKEGSIQEAEVIYTAPQTDENRNTQKTQEQQDTQQNLQKQYLKEKLDKINQNIQIGTYDVGRFLGDIFAAGNRDEGDVEDDVYSTRYFAILYDSGGEVESIITNHISYLSESDAKVLGDYARSRFLSFDQYGQYYYMCARLGEDRSIVVYLDSTNEINSTSRLLYSALLLIIFGIGITFLMVRILSSRAIAPEIRNAELQKQFITNASHELKTPLAVIKANTEMEEILNGESEWTQSTLRQVDRLNGLIQNLVMITRAQEHETEERIVINVAQSIADTAKAYEPVAAQEDKSLEMQLPESLTMKAVESEIRQLATLLIDNAIKYCDEKGTIQVSAGQKGREIWLVVSNSYAEGASVDYSRFFERFYRQEEAHTIDTEKTAKGGYGIGLSIAENLVRKYNGSIAASWKDGVIYFTCTLR